MTSQTAIATCLVVVAVLAPGVEAGSAAGQKPGKPAGIATLVKLPSLGGNAEAHGINDAGTVIVGTASIGPASSTPLSERCRTASG